MIRITPLASGPAILCKPDSRGKGATKALCDAFDRGDQSFTFNGKIYGAKSVKNALRKCQHNKCAFCEAEIIRFHGDIEHFRPKGGYRQSSTQPLNQPGYYWLAYTWENLMLSCQWCNQKFKRNLFPLSNPSKRAKSHRVSTDNEKSLLVNPRAEEPAQWISFRDEYVYAVNGHRKGRVTIETFGLDEEYLNESRRDRLGPLSALCDARDSLRHTAETSGNLTSRDRQLLRKIEKNLDDASADRAIYAGMVRAVLSPR